LFTRADDVAAGVNRAFAAAAAVAAAAVLVGLVAWFLPVRRHEDPA
jgi:hypothetical protein